MSDDLFKDCDCGDCDLDCCDCDCSCDDCLPENNVFVLCFCIPPSKTNEAKKTNRADAPLDCCCFCCYGRRSSPPRRNKKGFCCWRLWCCFVRNDPSPPPSPPHPRRDGSYPPEDLDLYMNDNDMPPMGYTSGLKYPMPEEMRMHRDKSKETRKDPRSRENYLRRGERDERDAHKVASRDNKNGRVKKDTLEIRQYECSINQNLNSRGHLGMQGEIPLSFQEEDRPQGDYPRLPKANDDKKHKYDMTHQDQMLQGRWSTAAKYEESEGQRKH